MKKTAKKTPPEEKRGDLPDSPQDRERMQPEETILDLPEVKDIPGQENIHVPSMGELADTTISSDDEEGKALLNDEEDEEDEVMVTLYDANVTKDETELLANAADTMPTEDQMALQQAQLDKEDSDGESLNESVDLSGSDLDVPGSEEDDANEEIGEEDEENNSYSLSDDRD